MKKILSVMFLAVITATVVFAVDLSAGAGIRFGMGSTTTKVESISIKSTDSDIVFTGFFDATYAVAEVGFAKSLSQKYDGEDTKMGTTALNLGVYGKYPIAVGPAVIFPLAGFEFSKNLGITYDGTKVNKSDLDADSRASYDQFWLKAGVGADIAVTPSIYVRPTATFGYKLNSKMENDMIKLLKDADMKASITTTKFDLGVAVGFKF